MTTHPTRRAICIALLTLASSASTMRAHAHGGSAGEIEIAHPFATPTPAGALNGAAYLATLTNTGKQPDRLLRASTPAAQRVELHTMAVDAAGVMRMREVEAMPLAPGAAIKMRPGDGMHFMLMGLKQPLKEGDSFPMTLEFERSGKAEVKVVVQVPKAGAMAEHKH
jgi:periplasmic copper chaperone A